MQRLLMLINVLVVVFVQQNVILMPLNYIEIIQNVPIGGTVAIVSGRRPDITRAMEYLIEHNVGVEVIKDARAAE